MRVLNSDGNHHEVVDDAGRRRIVVTRAGQTPAEALAEPKAPKRSKPPSDIEVRLAALEAKAGVTKADIDAKRAEMVAARRAP